ncbi:aldo/keto reductase [uncultured Sulfitobacter sp.]|uniref:aldo/keto reductase n=1 Tax=uncultured Sulfitobacter sp. TaxID=191468 RepID=UPI0030DD831A
MVDVQAPNLVDMMSPDALKLGLGCSRLGSVNGATGPEAIKILHRALDEGVRFFDTSNIYGQGDSERLIGEALKGRNDCVVCSKGGKYLSLRRRMLVPFKGVLRTLVRGSKHARAGVANARANPMPTRWDGAFLTASLDASLRRLKRERIEMFMLHSPAASVIARGEAISALAAAQDAGKIGIIGVSVDDVACAEACLADPRIRALQVPLLPGVTEFEPVLAHAEKSGVYLVAREILGGASAVAGAQDPATYAHGRIIEVMRRPDVALPLVGTTKLQNLLASTAAAKAI